VILIVLRFTFLGTPRSPVRPPAPRRKYTDVEYKYILGWSGTYFGKDFGWIPGQRHF
jgi:hypothetical protein